MADVFGTATRTRVMRAIKGRNTKPERALRSALVRNGVKFVHGPIYIKYRLGLPCVPDIVFENDSLAVFVDGCFWHCCPLHFKAPKSGRQNGAAGWARKFAANVRRDRRMRDRLRRQGWYTMRVWEHEDPQAAAVRVMNRLERIRRR